MKLLLPLIFCLLLVNGGTRASTGVDAVYINGRVYTVNEKAPEAEAFAVTGGKFVAVGTSESIRKLAGDNTRMHDLKGQRVLPGLIDDHLHPDLAMESYFNISIDAEGTSFEEF